LDETGNARLNHLNFIKMKNLSKFSTYFMVVAMVLWLSAFVITPVGGWLTSTPHHEFYKGYFLVTSWMFIIAIPTFLALNKDVK
jgi:hypothetical protein